MQEPLRILMTTSGEEGVPSYVHPVFDIWLRLVSLKVIRRSRRMPEVDASWIHSPERSPEDGA